MVTATVLRRAIVRWWLVKAASSSTSSETLAASICGKKHYRAAAAAAFEEENSSKWLILPPFTHSASGSEIGRLISGRPFEGYPVASSTTAVKWILQCCPHLPRCLVQKLFRLRQVRKETSDAETEDRRLKRVGAKELMDVGDRIFLPKTIDRKGASTIVKSPDLFDQEESKFVRGLELYKDSAIIVINKPPGMPVQGGVGITRSLDALAEKYLRYDYDEPPRLVHRLDRDSSGILVMGRTAMSAAVLHSIFREKTFGASDNFVNSQKTLQKRYWALVIGSPRRREGLVSVPLGKVVVDDGKSERITVIDNPHTSSAQNAVTEYRVLESSLNGGYTWMELFPHTGRKHQLRVHCAQVLGTPIVGDYKYGWQAHKKLKPMPSSMQTRAMENGNLSDKKLLLHLHCSEIVLPNLSVILQHGKAVSDLHTAQAKNIRIDAPLPAHMQRSWDLLNF